MQRRKSNSRCRFLSSRINISLITRESKSRSLEIIIDFLIGKNQNQRIMKSDAQSPDSYVESLPEERKFAVNKLRKIIQKNLKPGFVEMMNYGMIGYVVPHKLYPSGYHCDPKLPLPFMNIASQKNFIALYHMGIYADEKLMDWFVTEYNKLGLPKLDMGKSCIRFKKPDQIPYELIGALSKKISTKEWISLYEKKFKK